MISIYIKVTLYTRSNILFIIILKEERKIKMEDKESQVIKMSILYKLRLIFSQGGKKEYTTDEIVELIDKMAIEKDF